MSEKTKPCPKCGQPSVFIRMRFDSETWMCQNEACANNRLYWYIDPPPRKANAAITVRPDPHFTVTVGAHVFNLTLPEALELETKLRVVIRSRAGYSANRYLEAVCASRELSQGAMMAKDRRQRMAEARWMVMRLMADEGFNRSEIGRQLSMDHGTILHGLKRLEVLMSVDRKLRSEFEFLKSQLEAKP